MKSFLFMIVLVVCSFLFSNCQKNHTNQELQVLKIRASENTAAKLSDFAENIEMIKLEKNDSCLISSIRNLEVTRKYIFVHSHKNLFQFNKNGEFIRKIGRTGRGPQEFKSIMSFTSSSEKERIYIGTLGKILSFDFNGNFIEKIKKYRLFDYLKVYDNQLFAFSPELEKSLESPFEYRIKAYQYSLDGGVLEDSLLLKTISLDHQVATYSSKMQYLSETSDRLYLYCPVLVPDPIIRDTLYYLEDKKLIPALKLDFNDLDVENGKNKNIRILNIKRTQRYLFSEYKYKQSGRLFLYDFKENIQYNSMGGIDDNIYGTGEVSLQPLDLMSNATYFVKNGYELEGIIEGISEDSNPVVFLVRLKD